MGFTGFPVGAVGSTPQLGGPGLALVVARSFSAAATVSIDNCFNWVFDNYVIWIQGSVSSSGYVNLRLRGAGSDSATNYNYSTLASSTSTPGSTRTTTGTSIDISYGLVSETFANSFELGNPALAVATTIRTIYPYSASSVSWQQTVGFHNSATAYDGFTLIPAAGTLTGKVRVYGVRN